MGGRAALPLHRCGTLRLRVGVVVGSRDVHFDGLHRWSGARHFRCRAAAPYGSASESSSVDASSAMLDCLAWRSNAAAAL